MLDSENKTNLGDDRRAFVAELLISVMQDRPDVVKTVHQWAIIGIDHYQQRRDDYIEQEQSRIFKHGDNWLSEGYIERSFASVRDYAVDMGLYIIDVDFTGVTLATTAEQIVADHHGKARRMKQRADRQSYRALQLNEKRGTELEVIAMQLQQLPDNVS